MSTFSGTKEQLVNALRTMPIRGGFAGQAIASAAADMIEGLVMDDLPLDDTSTIWATGGHYWQNPTFKRDKVEYTRPAPQPAADTRVVVKPLVWRETWGGVDDDIPRWEASTPFGANIGFSGAGLGFSKHADAAPEWVSQNKTLRQAEYKARILSAIIGNATPAPIDNIAEAARDEFVEWVCLHKASVLDGMTRREQADFTELFGKFRALARQGETP